MSPEYEIPDGCTPEERGAIEMANALVSQAKLHFLKAVERANNPGVIRHPKQTDPVYLHYADPYLQGRQAQLHDLIHTAGTAVGLIKNRELRRRREA